MNSSSLLEDFSVDETVRTIAVVGAGGKTSLMYALARELAGRHRTVVTTTTTKIFTPESHESPVVILLSVDPALHTLPQLVDQHRHVTVAAGKLPGGKLEGISLSTAETLLDTVHVVIVEADGAARLPIKAPDRWEPVIPEHADLVIPVIGLDCLGKPASPRWVFRLERFLAVTGLERGESISPEAIAELLLHPDGGLKGVPAGSGVIPFLNKLDLLDDPNAIARLTEKLETASKSRIKRIVVGKLHGGIATRLLILS